MKRKAEKELIKTGGEKVYPGEVESVLLTHPNIISCCVIGVPDPTWGESVLAVCKLDQDNELIQEEVREYVGGKTDADKVHKRNSVNEWRVTEKRISILT